MPSDENGVTPEDMVRAYDTLVLADVHAVIAYYLRHRDEVRAYLKQRAEEAEALYLRALAVKEKLLGAEHPDVAMTLNNLAVFYKSRQKLDEAAQLYRRALAIFEAALPPTHPKVTACRENYERLLREMNRRM